jgi:hypothetical protein
MTPSEWLEQIFAVAAASLTERAVASEENRSRLDGVCKSPSNRACVRLIMACLLAKLDRPEIDPRKPYTEIGTPDSFSGRSYDEQHITRFVQKHRLPCNSTTAFLTPVLRNIGRPLTPDLALIGKPRQLYADAQHLLHEVAEGRESAENMLIDTIRILIQMRDERLARLAQLQSELRAGADALPLSSEAVVALIRQHLACKYSSRLPVLVVAAAYQAVADRLGERLLPLQAHNAADEQTGAVGDIEITLENEDRICTVYEMKQKVVTIDDLDRAGQKLAGLSYRIDNYVVITTDRIDAATREYAATLYESTGGTEFVVLDCLGFVQHFLHLFHRRRAAFLDAYQSLLLAQPDSSVGLPLKEAFLALRRAAITTE